MRLHLLCVFNTIPSQQFSQCPFTGKCLRFAKMMQPLGFEVIEYANEGSESEANNKVPILREKEFKKLRELYDKEYPNELANVNSMIFKAFNNKLLKEIIKRAEPGD